MQPFNITLPKEVITDIKHNQIDFSLLEGKVIIGLCGYSKSGKDTIAKTFIDGYGYHRVAFADNIKKEMNMYLKELVLKDINIRDEAKIEILRKRGEFVDYWPLKISDIDFFTENLELKKTLRPYIMWYGETLRSINGQFYWINRAFFEDAKNFDKIVLSDVRRLAEMEIFKNSNEYKKRYIRSAAEVGLTITETQTTNNYGTLFFEVSQFGLTDNDTLTTETIQAAHEQWIFDDLILVDSRLPAEGNYRDKAVQSQLKKIINKFGIEKPLKAKNTQMSIFNHDLK